MARSFIVWSGVGGEGDHAAEEGVVHVYVVCVWKSGKKISERNQIKITRSHSDKRTIENRLEILPFFPIGYFQLVSKNFLLWTLMTNILWNQFLLKN